MDIGNLPIYSGVLDKNNNKTSVTGNKSRFFDSNNKQASSSSAEEKSAWEQIGDYELPAAPNSSNKVDEEEYEENHEQVQIPRKHTNNNKDTTKESDDVASIASEAAVKTTQ